MANTLDELIESIRAVDESDGEAIVTLAALVALQAIVSDRYGEEQVINKLIDAASRSNDASMRRKIGQVLLAFSSSKALNASRNFLLEVQVQSGERKMVYFEVERPTLDGRCSDIECPCPPPGTTIPHGSGYLYISQEVVDFRRDAHSIQDTERKLTRLGQQLGGFVMPGPGVVAPILMCERGARRRKLDLEIAAADARHWWETGLVPFRATPLAGTREATKERRQLRSQPKSANRKWWQFWKSGESDEQRNVRSVQDIQPSSNKATHLFILFDTPGPSDLQKEIREVITFLNQKFAEFSVSGGTKIKALVYSIPDVGDYIQITAHMLVYLKLEEGIEDAANKFTILCGGFNAHGNQYRVFQVAVATPKKLTDGNQEALQKTFDQIPDKVEDKRSIQQMVENDVAFGADFKQSITSDELQTVSSRQCTNCKQEVEPIKVSNNYFCPNCGTIWQRNQDSITGPDLATTEEQKHFCKHCKRNVSPSVIADIFYCPECGSRI